MKKQMFRELYYATDKQEEPITKEAVKTEMNKLIKPKKNKIIDKLFKKRGK